MSFIPRIDFDNVYPLIYRERDLRIGSFIVPLQGGDSIRLAIKITKYPLEANIYNLAFGPLDSYGRINDKIELKYVDNAKVFSTVLYFGLNYLIRNKEHSLGMAGSDNRRNGYYWEILQSNFSYLSKYLYLYGLNYFVRITRSGELQNENPFEFEDIHAVPEILVKTTNPPKHLYNYFIFGLINEINIQSKIIPFKI